MAVRWRRLAVFWLCLCLWPLPSQAQPRTFYVAPNGDDSGSGSWENPWATPGHGSRQLRPGDTLIIRAGRYVLRRYDEDILMPPSGTTDAWITIRGEEGARPILAGRDNLLAAIDISGVRYLRLENLEITHDAQAVGGAVTFRDAITGIDAPSAHIELRNLYVHHIDEFGLNLADVQDLHLVDCRFEYCGFGALGGPEGQHGGWRDVVIERCRLNHSGHYYRGGDGSNRPYDRPDGLGIEPSDGPITILDTIVTHNYGDGLDSKAAQTTIERCVVANNSCDGVKLWAGPSCVVNTLIYGRGDGDPTPTPWSAIVIDTQRSGASFSLINVTVDDLLGQNYLLHAQYDDPQVSIDLTLRNSIFSARGPRSSLWLAGAVHLNADHNLFYAPQSNVVLIHGDREYTAEELAVLGDGHLYGAPRFVAPAWGSEGDYHLRQDSPALDAGTSQGAPTIDLEGRPRGASPDLGAYEMGLPTFRRAFEPGWHLVSIPTLTLDPRIDRVLASLAGAYDWVETYDAAEGRRRYYDPLDPAASTLDRLEPGTAFWIHLTSSATLQISGSLTSTSQSLVGGWNLIGYPDLEARPVEEVLAPILESCRTVFGYDAGQRWRWYDVRAPRWATTLHYLEPGCGYWLWVQEACVLDISPESSK